MSDDQFASSVIITKHPFGLNTQASIESNAYVKDLWPLIYIIYSETKKELYVGETFNASARFQSHLKNQSRHSLDSLYVIASDRFNKSATLDIESYLIKYLSGDGQYKMQNANAGLVYHKYYLRDEYYKLFINIWGQLKKRRIALHDLPSIDNSNLFKYSPYKSLSPDQSATVQDIIQNLVSKKHRTLLVEGGAGTGKTVLASYLIKLLKTAPADLEEIEDDPESKTYFELILLLQQIYPNPTIGLVVPMTSLRATLRKVFKKVKGLNRTMVLAPSDVAKQEYDILLVDEAHRLRRRVSITNYKVFDETNAVLGLKQTEGNELDWVLLQSKTCILFYDKGQSIKPSDVRESAFEKIKGAKETALFQLTSQLRVRGGVDYINFVDQLFSQSLKEGARFENPAYEFLVFSDINHFISRIKEKENTDGLARVVAGFAWEWKSRNGYPYDIEIDGVNLKWNSITEDWINSASSQDEVGCIHTTQGYDLNYAGVILGPEISFDHAANRIYINKDKYHDRNGKNSILNDDELHYYIVNIYKTLMCRAIKGTFLYVCDPRLRAYFQKHVQSA